MNLNCSSYQVINETFTFIFFFLYIYTHINIQQSQEKLFLKQKTLILYSVVHSCLYLLKIFGDNFSLYASLILSNMLYHCFDTF